MEKLAKSSAQIKRCSQDDVMEVRQFIDSHWRRGHVLARDQALLRWQFDHTRAKEKDFQGLSILLAWEEDRIVGMVGLISFDLNIRGGAIPAVWLSNWLSIPQARTRGVGMELLWTIHDLGYQVIFVLGMTETVRKIYSALGFEILPGMPRWIGVFDAEKTARLLQGLDPQDEVNMLHDLCARHLVDIGTKVFNSTNVEVVDWDEPFASDWDSFWRAHLAPSLVGSNKDSSYLNWRYIKHPTFRYEIRLARQPLTRKILGLIVFRVEKIRERDEKILRVIEFLSTAEAEGPLAQSLIRAAEDYNTIFADFYCTSEKIARALEVIGFKRHSPDEKRISFPSRFQPFQPGHFEVSGAFWLSEALRNNLGALLELEDFYVTKSDGDQDRPN